MITAMRDREWIFAAPRPRMKARISAVITPITGGISTVKKGVSASAFSTLGVSPPPWISWGKIALPVR